MCVWQYLPVLLLFLFSELIRVCKGVASEAVGLSLYEGGALPPPGPLNSLHCYLPHLSSRMREGTPLGMIPETHKISFPVT